MSIRTEMTLAALIAAALLVAAFATSAQAGVDDYQTATFKAEVKGKQTFRTETHHAATDRCDTAYDTVTTETVKFKSSKPVKLTAMSIPQEKDPILTVGNGALRLPGKATVTRSNSYSSIPVPEDCGANGGGVPPGPGPDCGKKTVTPFYMNVEYYKTGHIEIQAEDQDSDVDPFERCGSGKFPFLLHGDRFGKRQDAELPKEDLFDEKIGKLITIGRGDEFIAFPDGFDETKIEWDLSLTRIKDKK